MILEIQNQSKSAIKFFTLSIISNNASETVSSKNSEIFMKTRFSRWLYKEYVEREYNEQDWTVLKMLEANHHEKQLEC